MHCIGSVELFGIGPLRTAHLDSPKSGSGADMLSAYHPIATGERKCRIDSFVPSRLLKMQLNWHWLRVGVVYEFTALPTLPFGSLLSIKRLLRSTWAT
jgi:hypothetical protein